MSEPGGSVIICSNPDCEIAQTGKCVEGMERDKCPHFGKPRSEAPSETATVPSFVQLPPGTALSVGDVSKILRAGETRIVSIVGPSDAGKTSLIASLYDLFQNGAVAGLEFAGSRTLFEFEQTCHDARAASQRGTPHINRTPLGEVRFYHLQVAGGDTGEGLALALADRAGEEYRSAIDDISLASAFDEIRRSDTITILVDGERLLNTGARHNVRSEIIMIVQALQESGAVARTARVALVLTKLDLVFESANRDRVERDFEAVCGSLRELFGSLFSTIQTFRVAASPKTLALRRGTGIDELLKFWLHPAPNPPTCPPSVPPAERAFGRLTEIEPEELTP